MAGSRLEKVGSIYTRMRGLLQSGALKDADKPLWYDVYEAFPPKTTPLYSRPEPTEPVRNILYAEDLIRAHFYKVYGNPDVVDLQNEKVKTTCQKFVEKYLKLAADRKDHSELFKLTSEALKTEGIRLRTLREIQQEKDKIASKPFASVQSEPLSAEEVFGSIAQNRRADNDEVMDSEADDFR